MKNHFSITFLAVFAAVIVSSCHKEGNEITKTINVTLAPNETYTYSIAAAGDADDVMEIAKQATHYLTSTVAVDANTRNAVFTYTPTENYIGTDEVDVKNIEHHQSNGLNNHPQRGNGNCQVHRHHEEDEITYIFKITIQASSGNHPG